MNEYVYRQEINLIEIADEYAKRIQERVDEIALDKAAGTLAKYGYVKVVRCRDCAYICNREYANGLEFHTCSYFDSEHAEVEPDGFCKWGERRDA